MNNITEAEVEKVIEYFDDKEEYCIQCLGTEEKCKCSEPTAFTKDHTFIGDVLEKVKDIKVKVTTGMCVAIVNEKEDPEDPEDWDDDAIGWVIDLWQPFGLDKSLQQIVEESGWEWRKCEDEKCNCKDWDDNCEIEVLKSPEANALFGFLHSLIK